MSNHNSKEFQELHGEDKVKSDACRSKTSSVVLSRLYVNKDNWASLIQGTTNFLEASKGHKSCKSRVNLD